MIVDFITDVVRNLVWKRGFQLPSAFPKAEVFYFCFIDYAKAFDCVNYHKLWKILKEMEIPDHLTCLLRNLYAGQEATIRAGHKQWTGCISLQSEGLSRVSNSTLWSIFMVFIIEGWEN